MKNKKEYGQDFLTRPRRISTDAEEIFNTRHIWRFDRENEVFTMSYLGILNTYLSWIKLEVVAEVENGYINKYILRKKV